MLAPRRLVVAAIALVSGACRSTIESQATGTSSSSTDASSAASAGVGGSPSGGGGTALIGAGGAGGGGFGGACTGAVIHVEVDGAPVNDLDACCGGWGCNVSQRPVGYLLSGPAHLLGDVIVDGCATAGAPRVRAEGVFSGGSGGTGGASTAPASIDFTDAAGTMYASSEPGALDVTTFGDVGKVIIGTLSGTVAHAGETHAITASFRVCHVPDENLP
jgi:hypothetical protein